MSGRIWARLSQEAQVNSQVKIPTRPASPSESYRLDATFRWVEPLVYDVLEPTGRYVGQVRFPDNVVQVGLAQGRWFVSGDRVWAVVQDDNDVETVRRYRIEWAR